MTNIGERDSGAENLPVDITIATTHPNGDGVKRYKQILDYRLDERYGEGRRHPDEEFRISIQEYEPKEIIRAALYGGLRPDREVKAEEFIERNGERSEYTLVINKALSEMVLMVGGETYPLRPSKGIKGRKVDVDVR